MSETFGARLRAARERQGISLAEVATRTKIKASLFGELEQDDVSHWPVGIFRRSFIRAYADAVGLDADAVVSEFLKYFPDPSSRAHEGHQQSPPRRLPTAAGGHAGETPGPGQPAPFSAPPLRLTLVDTGLPFLGGRHLADARDRLSALACDIGVLLLIAGAAFVVLDAFWMPLGIAAVCYYGVGITAFGNSPGAWLFAPRRTTDRRRRTLTLPRSRPGTSAPPGSGDPGARAGQSHTRR